MLVNLPNAAPSRAITYTFEAEERREKLQKILDQAKREVLGRIEGDIPAVFINENPEVKLYFQDIDYCNY